MLFKKKIVFTEGMNETGHFSIQAHKDLRHNNIHHALRFSFFLEYIHSIGTEFADGFQSLFGYCQ